MKRDISRLLCNIVMYNLYIAPNIEIHKVKHFGGTLFSIESKNHNEIIEEFIHVKCEINSYNIEYLDIDYITSHLPIDKYNLDCAYEFDKHELISQSNLSKLITDYYRDEEIAELDLNLLILDFLKENMKIDLNEIYYNNIGLDTHGFIREFYIVKNDNIWSIHIDYNYLLFNEFIYRGEFDVNNFIKIKKSNIKMDYLNKMVPQILLNINSIVAE